MRNTYNRLASLSPLFAVLVMCATSRAEAQAADFMQPHPTPRWTVDQSKCAKQYKNMGKVLQFYAGKARQFDSIAQDRHDFFAFKTQYFAMRESFGDLFYFGCKEAGKPSDKATAYQMYEHASVNHVPSAQYKLGRMLIDGDGVLKNQEAGMAWISAAAIEGSTEASTYLSSMGIKPPSPIWPNTYAQAALEAKEIYDGFWKEERAKIVSDLTILAVGAAASYVTAKATLGSTTTIKQQPTPQNVWKIPQITSMRRPTYCTIDGYITSSSITNNAYYYASAFCR